MDPAGDGWFEHANLALRRIDLALSAHNFTAMHTSAVEAAVSADITVRGTLQASQLPGAHGCPPRLYLEHIPWGRTENGPALGTHHCWRVRSWSQALCTGRGQAAVPTWHDLSLPFVRPNIGIDIPPNVWLQGPGTAIELSGNMRVTKDLYALLSSAVALKRCAAMPVITARDLRWKRARDLCWDTGTQSNAGCYSHPESLRFSCLNPRHRAGAAADDCLQQYA